MNSSSIVNTFTPHPAWRDKRYNAYGGYLRSRFGEKVRKISLEGGFTCPNRDGSQGFGGCVYCNNDSFVPPYIDRAMSIRDQIEVSLPFMKKRYGSEKHIAYFQAYSNTYADLDRLKTLYETALDHPQAVGLDIATRSDCIDEKLLSYLAGLNERVEVTLEYGIESRHDETLQWMNRGHDYESVVQAVALTKEFGLRVGGHIILGFPVESREMMVETGLVANELGLDFLKVHQLHVVRGTVLASQFEREPFPTLSTARYLELLVDILERLNPGIVLQRLFSESPPELLMAPRWDHTIPELLHQLDQAMLIRNTWQGRLWTDQ